MLFDYIFLTFILNAALLSLSDCKNFFLLNHTDQTFEQ